MISNRFLVLIFVFLAVAACKTQSTIHYPLPTIIRDSVSVTYKQGQTPLTPIDPTKPPLKGEDVQGQGGEEMSRTATAVVQRSGPTGQSPVVQRSGSTTIRVDTVFVERWHTQVLQPEGRSFSDSGHSESNANGLSAKRSQFYKNCTWGFWVLLIMLLGSVGFRILRIFMFRR